MHNVLRWFPFSFCVLVLFFAEEILQFLFMGLLPDFLLPLDFFVGYEVEGVE